MICIIAGNHKEAQIWASSQNLEHNEWFYPDDMHELLHKTNFHVLVVGTAGENVPPLYFEKIYTIALERGRIGRF